ncbi:hypothetical protein RBSWK_05484 [Rhodopirellula baltica SWK14]|uniref:Uncharacterized protein n=1 Tax=Rhodopirellula baltica SWK14 TaxID=993516 RepID=L7C977_RHOBT|nr:hypothetical protein RBSWK_05484 [Rhodopirellula baltica SWK14]
MAKRLKKNVEERPDAMVVFVTKHVGRNDREKPCEPFRRWPNSTYFTLP